MVDTATFGAESFDFTTNLQASLSSTQDDFTFPLAFFDRITNYFIFLYSQFDRRNDFTLFSTSACPTDAPDLVFNVETLENKTIPITVKASSYLRFNSVSSICEVLFKPSTSDKLQLGDNFFQRYVVSFDSGAAPSNLPRIGFTDRLQTPIPKSVEELLMQQI